MDAEKPDINYELAHDSIARQVYAKAGAEARARRKAERLLRERYEAWESRGAELTQDDVDYLRPYLATMNSPEEQLNFVRQTARNLRRRRRLRLILLSATSLAFAILAAWALGQRDVAQEREAQSRSMRVSLAARYALYEGQPTLAFRLAEQTLKWQNDTAAMHIASDVLAEIRQNPLVRDLTHADTITAMQFSRDGELMLTASLDGEVRISDLFGKRQHAFPHDTGVIWAKFVLQDRGVLSLTRTGELRLWNRRTAKPQILAVPEPIREAKLVPDNQSLIARGAQTVYYWNLMKSTEPLRTWTLPDDIRAFVMQTKTDSLKLIAALITGQLGEWNEAGELLRAYPQQVDSTITDLKLDAAQERLIVNTLAGDFLLRANGDTLSQAVAIVFRAFQPCNTVPSATTDPDRMVSVSRNSELAYVWNMAENKNKRGLDLQWSPREKVRYAALSQDGNRLVAGSTDNEMIVHRLKDNLMDQNIELFRFSNSLAWGTFAPNGAHFLSTAGGKEALLWKFDDSTYVANKRALSEEQLLKYYQSRIRPLTDAESKTYQLDKKHLDYD